MFRFDVLQGAYRRHVHLILRLWAAVAQRIIRDVEIVLFCAGLRKVDNNVFELRPFWLLPCGDEGLFGLRLVRIPVHSDSATKGFDILAGFRYVFRFSLSVIQINDLALVKHP